jgi:hypothetical protein
VKFAPKLSYSVMYPTHFKQMSEPIACNLISSEVRAAVQAMNLRQLDKLRAIINDNEGWSKDNVEKYKKDIKFLHYMADEFLPNKNSLWSEAV